MLHFLINKKHFFYLLSLTVCVLMLQSCSSVHKRQKVYIGNNEYLSIQATDLKKRISTLNSIKNWTVSGNIAATSQKSAWNLNYLWKQTGYNYKVTLTTLLGLNKINIIGNDKSIQLINSNNQTIKKSVLDDLNKTIPINELSYWIRGIPYPKNKAGKGYNPNKHMVRIIQDGWHVTYLRYVTTQLCKTQIMDMPERILLTNDRGWRIGIGLSHWDMCDT